MLKCTERTNVGGFFETGVGDETDGGVIPFRVPKTVHDHENVLATKLCFDAFESSFQTEPEVDLLGGCPRSHISTQFRHGLDRFDPLVNVRMQGVQECAVAQEFLGDVVDAGSRSVALSLFDGFLNYGVNDQVRFWNLDVLL